MALGVALLSVHSIERDKIIAIIKAFLSLRTCLQRVLYSIDDRKLSIERVNVS